MVQTIQAETLNLYEVKTKFGLEVVEDEQFFREWSNHLPEITELERRQLDRVKLSYSNLDQHCSMLEDAVKMVVLSPLLDLAGFYLPPFRISTEEPVQVSAEDNGVVVRGRIDVLVVQNQLWVLAIESKSTKFAITQAIPQALAYMMASSNADRPTFGLVTDGIQFIFIKLLKQDTSHYALSDEFTLLRRGNDLYGVLSVLKRLGELISQ